MKRWPLVALGAFLAVVCGCCGVAIATSDTPAPGGSDRVITTGEPAEELEPTEAEPTEEPVDSDVDIDVDVDVDDGGESRYCRKRWWC